MNARSKLSLGWLISSVAVVGLTTDSSLGAPATNYPNKPVRLIVPMVPDGAVDVMARLLAAKLAEIWGQPVLVDNRPGGDGSIAPGIVLQAPRDGYTILNISLSQGMNGALYKNLPYDLVNDFTPITQLIGGPMPAPRGRTGLPGGVRPQPR